MIKKIDIADVIAEEYKIRCEVYSLLGVLFREAPQISLLQWLGGLELEKIPNNDISEAWNNLKKIAQSCSQKQVLEEYQLVFIGVGQGEVVPYASWYIAGALMDTPLARLREDLRRFGFIRQHNVKEPEDHIAALMEVMALLIQEEDEKIQALFFHEHLSTWCNALFEDIEHAHSAVFYRAVAKLAKDFLNIEKIRFIQRC